MKIFTKKELTSTSIEARKMLEAGEKLPFLVTALTQTGGRGRTGRQWSSPKGNAYFTLAVPMYRVAPELISTIPLRVGYLIASFFQRSFNLCLTLKWPNDLLFGGAKVGGILCETQASGDSFGPCLIGVGLNFNLAPKVNDQQTISIGAILGRWFTEEEIATSIKAISLWLLEHWQQPLDHRLDEFFLDKGQPWTDGHEVLFQGDLNKQSGTLKLMNLESQKETSLSSSHHNYKWLYQNPESPLFVADVGNSSLKLGFFSSRTALPHVWYINLAESIEQSKVDAIRALVPSGDWPLHVGSVNRSFTAALWNLAQTLGLTVVPIKKRPIVVDFSGYEFSEIGIDRVALVEALATIDPSHHKIGVSCGTALTVEVLTVDRIYRGGWIIPGFNTALKALHDSTDQLPLLALPKQIPQTLSLGENTKTAIAGGIVQGAALMLKQLRTDLLKKYGGTWRIYVTGGTGQVLAKSLDVGFYESLILEGFKRLVLRG